MVPRGPEYDYVEKPSMALLEELGWTAVDAFHETLGRRARSVVTASTMSY
jgi:type I restriction enzyme R subunit